MIWNINESDFRRTDLNLLLVFSALLRERSVTRAASRLYLGQPAVSAALSRLREVFKDELFVRTGRGMEPTARALALAQELGPALETIHGAIFGAAEFNPATAQRVFRLGMPDGVEVALGPALLDRIQCCAPGVSIAIHLAGGDLGPQLLDDDEIDLGISVFPEVSSWHRREVLYEEGYACLYDGRRLGIGAPIGLETYLAHPHLLMSFKGAIEGVVDEHLARRNLRRRVALSTVRFSTLPFMLREADAIATLPASLARRFAEAFSLTLSPVPLPLETFTISMLWHARRDRDAGHVWLRELIREIVLGSLKPDPRRAARKRRQADGSAGDRT